MAQFNSYPQKATPIAADTVLIYDSAGAVLKQVPIKNLFENYAGTSLGGSAQTVKSAIDALNSNLSKYTATDTSTISLEDSETFTNVAHVDLDLNGYYLIIANVTFSANNNGSRGVTLSPNASTADSAWFVNEHASPSGSTATQIIRFHYAVQGYTRMNLLVRQISGSALNCTNRMFAIRLK